MLAILCNNRCLFLIKVPNRNRLLEFRHMTDIDKTYLKISKSQNFTNKKTASNAGISWPTLMNNIANTV